MVLYRGGKSYLNGRIKGCIDTLISAIMNREWLNVCLLIFVNNMFLGALVLRTIYGLTIIFPYILTVWEGLAQGVVFSKTKTKPSLIFFFEFGGYLFASLSGISLGLSLLLSLTEGVRIFVTALEHIIYIYLIVMLLLFFGVLTEVLFMKKLGPPKTSEFDINKLVKKMPENIEKT